MCELLRKRKIHLTSGDMWRRERKRERDFIVRVDTLSALMDRVAVEGGLFSVRYRVAAVDSHRPVIVRDWEGEDFLMKLFFALH